MEHVFFFLFFTGDPLPSNGTFTLPIPNSSPLFESNLNKVLQRGKLESLLFIIYFKHLFFIQFYKFKVFRFYVCSVLFLILRRQNSVDSNRSLSLMIIIEKQYYFFSTRKC